MHFCRSNRWSRIILAWFEKATEVILYNAKRWSWSYCFGVPLLSPLYLMCLLWEAHRIWNVSVKYWRMVYWRLLQRFSGRKFPGFFNRTMLPYIPLLTLENRLIKTMNVLYPGQCAPQIVKISRTCVAYFPEQCTVMVGNSLIQIIWLIPYNIVRKELALKLSLSCTEA